jgi:hypothetical protein
VEQRAHGGAEGVTRRSKVGVVLGFESAAKDGDKDGGGFGVAR